MNNVTIHREVKVFFWKCEIAHETIKITAIFLKMLFENMKIRQNLMID